MLVLPAVKHHQRGFTLIEIILVVFIIGLAVSVISIAVGGNALAERSKKAAETFFLQASYIAEQSVMRGETHGLFIIQQQPTEADAQPQWCYEWQRVRDSQWQSVLELSQTCLDEGLALEVLIDEELWEYDPEVEFPAPVIVFYPGGDASAVADISIFIEQQFSNRSDEETQRFVVDISGELRWINEEEAAQNELSGQ